jgi:hypothetical protein
MRKRSSYRPGPVAAWLPKSDRMTIQIMSHVMVDKLVSGLFDELDANTVAYELNITRRLAVIGNHESIRRAADECMAAYLGIRDRQLKTGKWGANGQEFQTFRQYLGGLSDCFSRQPVHRIESARQWVLAINKKMQAAGALSADIGDDMKLENVVRAA